ncbi:MAG TPA: hypothetical protein VFE58_05720 [Tepidisphaeraceae bacterium]|nr:hypothetical protein [Tepidisphaeraceae bacterium]
MGRSFFTGTDAELYIGSDLFATKITATPTAFGLVAAQATAYSAVSATWRTAYTVAADPVTRTKASVSAKNAARTAVKTMASSLAKIINGTPTVTDAQKIDLGLSVRATPSPVAPPGTPSRFAVALSAGGALKVSWKCANPAGSAGTIYQVWRRVGATGDFVYLGGSGEKNFTDETLPAGSAAVTYQIQGVRSTSVGPFAQFNVNFGTGTGGTRIASATPVITPKLAA